MNKYLFILLLLFIANTSSAANTQRLRLHGSNTIGAALAPGLVKKWLNHKGYNIVSDKFLAKEERLIVASKADQRIEVEIHAHGSSTSFRDFAHGKTDVGMSSRPIKQKELKKLSFLGDLKSRDSEYIIALDGLPIIVHPSNPLNTLDKETVTKIFSGQITQWRQLGIKRGRIHLYARDNNSGTYDTFKSLVLSKKAPLAKSAKRFESNAILSDSVAQDPDGIGFTGLAYVRKSKVLAISDAGSKALKPNTYTVATEDYTLARRLFLYIPEKDATPLAQDFANFSATSNIADKIVTKVGFVSQRILPFKMSIDKTAPLEYRKLTEKAQRLSLNIRFRPGSVRLDNKALRDIERISRYLSQLQRKRRKIMLFGFSDSHEVAPYVSLSLSVQRADIVADSLLREHVAPYKVRGYGQQLQVASDKTNKGRYRNRRVEIWLKE